MSAVLPSEIEAEPRPIEEVMAGIKRELMLIWAAHRAVGLKGYMCLYSEEDQSVWRSASSGLRVWFNEEETDEAVGQLRLHYRDGALPNTPLLLNPVVFEKDADGDYSPIGSGFFWATGFTLGVAKMSPDMDERIAIQRVMHSRFHRGDEVNAGLKMIGFSKTMIPSNEDGRTVSGCREIYELSNLQSEPYASYYMLSGLEYLCTHGLFSHPDIDALIPEGERELSLDEIVVKHQVDVQETLDATFCFNAYDRMHSLFMRFGSNPADVDRNNRFYNLCARDIELFDRTGATRKEGSEEKFEFIVQGLIPRGAVTLIAAPGGTGKSSISHQLCVLASIDYEPHEPKPLWLGQPINTEFCKGICVYFSGEDGPAIVNARAEMFDPEKRSQRIQLHRTEFADKEMTFSQYLNGLRKMPDVPIIVIDPARKYLTGDENDADVVSEFFEAIDEFAIRKKAAVLVVHHLQKGAKPKNARECLDELRGSQVFIDRPRVVIGMCRVGPNVQIGLAKNNIPPNLGMVTQERVFGRNPKNLQLIQLPGAAGVVPDTLTAEQIEELELQAELEKERQELAAQGHVV